MNEMGHGSHTFLNPGSPKPSTGDSAAENWWKFFLSQLGQELGNPPLNLYHMVFK
jgi:hypothetical protein